MKARKKIFCVSKVSFFSSLSWHVFQKNAITTRATVVQPNPLQDAVAMENVMAIYAGRKHDCIFYFEINKANATCGINTHLLYHLSRPFNINKEIRLFSI